MPEMAIDTGFHSDIMGIFKLLYTLYPIVDIIHYYYIYTLW